MRVVWYCAIRSSFEASTPPVPSSSVILCIKKIKSPQDQQLHFLPIFLPLSLVMSVGKEKEQGCLVPVSTKRNYNLQPCRRWRISFRNEPIFGTILSFAKSWLITYMFSLFINSRLFYVLTNHRAMSSSHRHFVIWAYCSYSCSEPSFFSVSEESGQ